MDQEIQIVRECILPHYAAQQKEDIIQELSKRMKERNLVNADFQEAVLKREQKYPTGLLIGKRNIAIPHTEPQYVKVPCIGIATLKKSVAFHRMDACDELLVVCGAGTLTSVIASQGVEQGLKKRGITDVEIKVGRLDDIGRYADRITVLVASMNIRQKYDFPVINAISFLTGDEDGQERVVDKVADILKNK